MKSIKHISNKALLIILDGYGINDNKIKNAVKDANTPTLDMLFKSYPYTKITAGGEQVGLPKGVAGNSEVGHMNLGSGRSIRQDLVRINEVIKNGTLAELPELNELVSVAKSKTKRIHLMGLLSDGGVHSHIDHIKELIKALSKSQDIEIFFHAFMDGRDTPKDNGKKYINDLLTIPGFKFASIQGRSIAMDRDRRWEKIKSCYDTLLGHASISNLSPIDYLDAEYKEGRFDEFITPALFSKEFAIREDDCVFFINFRPDRAIQLSMAFNYPKFTEFKRPFIPPYFLCMTPYIPDEMKLPILFDKEKVTGGLTDYLSRLGKKQLKIAETEKYAHVTFFFNGGEKKEFSGEDHILIPSPKEITTYDQKPEMSAFLVCDELISKINNYDFTVVNFANSDMVGHTGNYEASIKAVEVLDLCIKRIFDHCLENNIAMAITADHGNSDEMTYSDGSPHTSHTGAAVPFCVVHKDLKNCDYRINNGDHALKDVASTMLYILGIDRPKIFTGTNIFK